MQSGMLHCPVCNHPTQNQRALGQHFRAHSTDADHAAYRSRDAFAGLTEGVDYVTCRACGKPSVSLCRHLGVVHQLTIVQYREQFGADALTQGTKTTNKTTLARRGLPNPSKGRTKSTPCGTCGNPFDVPLSVSTKTPRDCPSCKQSQADSVASAKQRSWDGNSEPDDYVTCRVCGHRSASLASHIQSKHPEMSGRYQVVFPGARVVSGTVGKTIQMGVRGRPRSEAWKQKMSTIFRTQFTLTDFAPYMEPDGTLDHHAAAKGLCVGLPIIKRTAHNLGVLRTRRHSLGRADYKKVILTETDLAPFKLKNGKLAVGKAAQALGYNHLTVLKNCVRLGLPVAHKAISQELFLDTVSRALDGADYIQEWSPPGFINQKTGGRFRFDGYFQNHNLLAEFHGFAHYTFPNPYHRTLDDYQRSQERDRSKQRMAQGLYHLLVVRQDEPWDDVTYVRGKLAQLGL